MPRIIAFPFPCPCGNHGPNPNLPSKMIHSKEGRCPFVSKEYQHEVAQGTCCTMDQTELVRALADYGDAGLVRAVCSRVTAEDALVLRKDLVFIADRFFPEDADDNDDDGRRLLMADETIRVSADWYWKIGSAGFGVDVEAEPEE